MNSRRIIRQFGAALLAAGLCVGTAALADNELPTIKVEASVISKKVISTSDIGVPTEEVTITRRISYADLNLRTYSGAQTLKRRVEEAARLVCQQMDKLYPMERPEEPTCVKDAIASSDRQVEDAIAAAQHNPPE